MLFVWLNAGASGMRTYSFTPSRLNASPTRPAVNDTPFTSVPWWSPALSEASPSACHQADGPGTGETQPGPQPAEPTGSPGGVPGQASQESPTPSPSVSVPEEIRNSHGLRAR